MAKTTANSVFDAALDKIGTSTLLTLCNAQPTSLAEGGTGGTFVLAEHVMAGGDFSNADGDVSGRKVIVAAQAAVDVDTTGTGLFAALSDATEILEVTTVTSQAVTSGNTVDFPAWDIEFEDPT